MPDDRVTEALGALIFEVLRSAAALTETGDALMRPLGLTGARWQVLATAAHFRAPQTVSDLARHLSQARQSVQRVVDDLAAAGLVELAENPAHARARLVCPSARGRAVLAEAEAVRQPWTAGLAQGLDAAEIATAAQVLRGLRARLMAGPAGGRGTR
jgi:DNA-binding MarR family transcriptional regulator